MPMNLAERCCKAKLPSPLSTLAALPPCTLRTTGLCEHACMKRECRAHYLISRYSLSAMPVICDLLQQFIDLLLVQRDRPSSLKTKLI